MHIFKQERVTFYFKQVCLNYILNFSFVKESKFEVLDIITTKYYGINLHEPYPTSNKLLTGGVIISKRKRDCFKRGV